MILQFDKMEIPKLVDTKSYNGNYYLPGIDGKFFEYLLKLYYESSIHSAIIQNLHRRMQEGYEDDEIFYKISLDYLIFGGYSLQVLWNFNHDKITQLIPLDYSLVRCGLQDDYGSISMFYYSNDWNKYNNRKIEILAPYNENPVTDDNQCFYYRRYNPGTEIYSKPYYYSALKWIATDIQLENYYANLVKNNFVANTIMNVNSYMDEAQQKDFEKMITKSYTGSDNGGSMVVMYNENKESAVTIERFNSEDDTKYQYITDKINENISIGHNLPTQLLGILTPGKLSQASDIPVFDAIYDKYVVLPMKNEIVNSYEKLKNKLITNE